MADDTILVGTGRHIRLVDELGSPRLTVCLYVRDDDVRSVVVGYTLDDLREQTALRGALAAAAIRVQRTAPPSITLYGDIALAPTPASAAALRIAKSYLKNPDRSAS